MKARIPNQGAGGNMMKKIKEMQQNMQTLQEELAVAEYSASSGGGAVDVTVNGSHEVKKVTIKPEVVDPEDVELLEDMLIAALNEAMRKADETAEREMGKITGGINIPGMNGMF